jgi:hypothetical protein
MTVVETLKVYRETNPTGPVITTAGLVIERLSDGQYRFIDGVTGDTMETSGSWADRIFDTLGGLV